MGSFSWRVNGIPNSAVGGRGIAEGVPGADPAVLPAEYTDTYLQKVTKVVPVEIVGGYALALQIVPTFPESQRLAVLIAIFVGGFFLTIGAMYFERGLYRKKEDATGVERRDRQELIQIILAVIAFLLWAYVQGGVFEAGPVRGVPFFDKDFWPYSPGLGTIAVIGFGIILNWFKPEPVIDRSV
jgi:hypothetical protein